MATVLAMPEAVMAEVMAAAVGVAAAAAMAVAHATKSLPSIEFDFTRPSHCGTDAFFISSFAPS